MTSLVHTYYVSKFGNDNNNGGPATPWLTIQKAINTIVAGDITNVETGTYNEALVPNSSGTPGNYITLQNYSGQTVTVQPASGHSGIFLNGKSYWQFIGLDITCSGAGSCGVLFENGSNYLLFQNLAITGDRDGAIIGTGTLNSYITIDGCICTNNCSNNDNSHIVLQTVWNFEIKNCIVSNSASAARSGIDVIMTSNGAIHNNTIHNVTSHGIDINAYGKAVSDIKIYNNLIYNCTMFGISIADQNASGTGSLTNISAYNNIVSGGMRGIAVTTAVAEPCTFISLMNNTLYNCDSVSTTIWWQWTHTNYTSCVTRNNIIVSAKAGYYGIQYNDYANGGVTVDHNLFYNSAGSWASGNVFGTSYVAGNPLFSNPAGNDFHIQAASPAINAGSSVGAPLTDYDNNSRQGSSYDIGAYVSPPPTGFVHGSTHAATFQATSTPSGQSCQLELWIGPNATTKSTTSGMVSFNSTGAAQNMTPSIVMPPTAGTYHVYIDIYMLGAKIASFVGSSTITVT